MVFDQTKLNTFEKPELINLIMQLENEKEELKSGELNNIIERVTKLERSQYLYEQYGRRESIEISGIPDNIEQKNLEDEVIKVFKEAKVEVHGRELRSDDISACHRIGKRGATIVRFVNRKFAYQGLYNGKNLKGSKLYENNIYINNSFCREFARYGFFIRRLKRDGLVVAVKVSKGVYQIKTDASQEFVEISHISDFSKYGLDVNSFM